MVSVLHPCWSHPPPHILLCSQLVKLQPHYSFTWLSYRLRAVHLLPCSLHLFCTRPVAWASLSSSDLVQNPVFCYVLLWEALLRFSQALNRDKPCPSEVTAATAKSLPSCPTLCNPIDGSPQGSPVPGILQARTLEWVAISFSNAWKWKVKVKLLSSARPSATPWTAAFQAPPSMGFSRQEYWSGVPFPSPSEVTR